MILTMKKMLCNRKIYISSYRTKEKEIQLSFPFVLIADKDKKTEYRSPPYSSKLQTDVF